MDEESEVPIISVMPDDTVDLEKVFCHGFYAMQNFTNMDVVGGKYDQSDMYLDPDEEDMEDLIIDDKRDRHWRMVFKDN